MIRTALIECTERPEWVGKTFFGVFSDDPEDIPEEWFSLWYKPGFPLVREVLRWLHRGDSSVVFVSEIGQGEWVAHLRHLPINEGTIRIVEVLS